MKIEFGFEMNKYGILNCQRISDQNHLIELVENGRILIRMQNYQKLSIIA